jgi:hypothetical protein
MKSEYISLSIIIIWATLLIILERLVSVSERIQDIPRRLLDGLLLVYYRAELIH